MISFNIKGEIHMDFDKLEAGMQIEYIGDSFAFGGEYLLSTSESTYEDINDCPEHEKGKLMIIEFMNNDNPMFFTLDMLNEKEWKLAV
jgi:hypothetical protein